MTMSDRYTQRGREYLYMYLKMVLWKWYEKRTWVCIAKRAGNSGVKPQFAAYIYYDNAVAHQRSSVGVRGCDGDHGHRGHGAC